LFTSSSIDSFGHCELRSVQEYEFRSTALGTTGSGNLGYLSSRYDHNFTNPPTALAALDSCSCPASTGALPGTARCLSGPELDAVYAAIDLIREEDDYRAIGDALMENAHLLQAQRMGRHTRGRTPFFTQGGFVLNERLTRRVVETPDSQCAMAELAGTLVHEYLHTQQLGAERGPVGQAFNQLAYGFMYAISLPLEASGIGPRDQNGQGHGFVEIDPWRAGNDAQERIFEALQKQTIESRAARSSSNAGDKIRGRVG
jgi:hypothetical protein